MLLYRIKGDLGECIKRGVTEEVKGVGVLKDESEEIVVYYESIKRELKTRPIYECRCDERIKPKGEESTRLSYTG